MTDQPEFTLDVTVNPHDSFKPLPDLVAFDLCMVHAMPDNHLLLYNERNGRRTKITPDVYTALLSCQQFNTLEQHVSNIITANPGMQGQQADILLVLQSMLVDGMLLSAKEVCDTLRRDVDQQVTEKDSSAPVVVIITWERPQALERLLTSMQANCNIENFHRLYVVDDSREQENINQNQAIVAQFAAEFDTPLRYFGQAEQQNLLSQLTQQLPEHENALRFLANQAQWRDQWTSGLARNLALLLSCGHRLVMLDDDTLCEVYNPGQPKQEITFSTMPRETDFFDDMKDWAGQRQPINPDPVDRHMQCLGLSFSDALGVLGQNHFKPAGLKNATALLLSELKQDSVVLMTECGSLGCPGTGGNTWLPDMSPDSLKAMLTSERKTHNALSKRTVWCGRNQPHFGPRTNMSQITGFDNRHLLPPYLPVFRGEDRLFGFLLNFIFPTAITLDYPWAIPHLPIPERHWLDDDRDFTPHGSFPMFFFEQLLDRKSICFAGTAEQRLASLSAWFNELSSASATTLTAMYRDTKMHNIAEQLQHLSALLAEAEDTSAPAEWQDYLKNGIEQLNIGIDQASLEEFPLKGLPASLEGDDLIAFWKETWAGFAAALSAWPAIRQAAAELDL